MGKMKLPLPDDLNPPLTRCVTLHIPADVQWQSMFWGNLYNLTSATIYANDVDHSALQVADLWWQIYQAARVDPCCIDDTTTVIEEMSYDMSVCEQLRIHNGKIQGLCCGEWTDIAGQEGIVIGGPGQEGGGAPQPEPGGCQTYHAQIAATGAYLVPTVVNTGDVITFTNADGSGADGAFLGSWYCPDGGTFFGGLCLPIYTTDGGDPAPAISHMALIAEINAVFYPAYSGSITVPSGIVNEQIIIRVNDSTITDNSGSYSLDVEVCNNAVAANYSHLFNFALGPNGWAVQGVNGNGWSAGAFQGKITMTASENRIYINFPAGTSITSFSAHVNVDTVLGGLFITAYDDPNCTGTGTTVYNQGLANGSTANRNATVTAGLTVGAGKESLLIESTGETTATYNQTFSVTLNGLGPDPF